MAITPLDNVKTNYDRIVLLQAAESSTEIYLSDLNSSNLGTNRRSEIYGKIGGVGRSWNQAYNVYLDSL